MAEQSLKDKTVKGVGWSAIDNVAQYAVSFIVSIILARLLSPDDYGLLGIIAIFTAVCTALINGGFTTALIRKKDCTDDDYNTTFIVNISASLIIYFIIFLLSPFIANFFGRVELVVLTQVSSLGMIVGAVSMVQQTKLTKRIDFKSQAKITFFSSLISGVIGIVLALFGFGVWSLVAQQLGFQVLRTIQLWIINKWKPTLRFSGKSFRDLFGFGWKMMISGVLDSTWKELYQVIIGKLYSPATLGQYTRSNHFSQLFSSNLTNVIQRVTYPVLSNIQNDQEHMLIAYRKLIKVTTFVTAICMFFLGAISEPLIYCMIGPKWYEASIYLPLISVSASAFPLHALNLNMLQVQGRSDLFLGLEIVKKIILLVPLGIGVFVGIIPMLYANIVTNFFIFFVNSYYSGRFIGYSTWMQMKDISSSYVISLFLFLIVFCLKYLPMSYWLILPIQIIIGISFLLIICHVTKNEEYKELVMIIKPICNRLTSKFVTNE